MSEETKQPELTAEQLLELTKAGIQPEIPEAPEVVEPEAVKAPVELLHVCPRCTYRLRNVDGSITEKVTPEEEEVKEYVRRVMSGQRFTKEYTLFEGLARVKLSTLSTSETKAMQRILRGLTLDDGKNETLQSTIFQLQLLCSVRSIEQGANARTFEFPDCSTVQSIQDQFDLRFGEDDEWMVALLIRINDQFQRLNRLLAEASFSENFWKGAGLS